MDPLNPLLRGPCISLKELMFKILMYVFTYVLSLIIYKICPYFQVKPLIWIESVIERHAHSRIEFMVKAKSQFKRRSTANNVEIIIPVPNDADSPKFKQSIGHCKYTPETQCIVWTIKSFPGKPQPSLLKGPRIIAEAFRVLSPAKNR